MSTATTRTHRPPEHNTSSASRFTFLAGICVLVAIAANLGLYAIGRATDATLRIDPGAGQSAHQIVAGDVAWKTAASLALGALVLVLTARRSRRWTTIVIAMGVAVAAVSIPVAMAGAHDTTTGLIVGGMHAITGVAYVLIGRVARPTGTE